MPVIGPDCRERPRAHREQTTSFSYPKYSVRNALIFSKVASQHANMTQARNVTMRTAVVSGKAESAEKKEIHGAAASAAEGFGFAEISCASVLILAGTPPRVLGLLRLDC
jgi:hypothetical protein